MIAPDAKKQDLRDIAKIKADAPSIGAAILPDFFPDQIRLICKAPRTKNFDPFRQQGIRNPQIQMTFFCSSFHNGKRFDILKLHRRISVQAFMFRRNFSRPILELPRRIRINRTIFFLTRKIFEIFYRKLDIRIGQIIRQHLEYTPSSYRLPRSDSRRCVGNPIGRAAFAYVL